MQLTLGRQGERSNVTTVETVVVARFRTKYQNMLSFSLLLLNMLISGNRLIKTIHIHLALLHTVVVEWHRKEESSTWTSRIAVKARHTTFPWNSIVNTCAVFVRIVPELDSFNLDTHPHLRNSCILQVGYLGIQGD